MPFRAVVALHEPLRALQPDVYAVQGYDAAQLLDIGLKAVKGDVKATKALEDPGRGCKMA